MTTRRKHKNPIRKQIYHLSKYKVYVREYSLFCLRADVSYFLCVQQRKKETSAIFGFIVRVMRLAYVNLYPSKIPLWTDLDSLQTVTSWHAFGLVTTSKSVLICYAWIMFTNILYVFLLKFVVTNILKTSGIQFALPSVIRCQCTLKKKEKKSSPGIRKKTGKLAQRL